MNRMKTTVLIAAGIFAGIFLGSPAAQALEEPSVAPIVQQFCLDGRTIDLTVYTVNGEEYVKLSDVSQKLNLSNSNTTPDTPYPVLPAVPAPTAGAAANTASSFPAGITVAPDGTITAKTILCDAWSKEDYSQAANPAVFTDPYTRERYNAIRQTVIDRDVILTENNEKDFAVKYLYAHTIIPFDSGEAYSAISAVLEHISGTCLYKFNAEPYTANQYERPGYSIICPYWSEAQTVPLAFLQDKLSEIEGMSVRDKVSALNSYLCSLMNYDIKSSAGAAQIFSNHAVPVYGKCSDYAYAFSFLCDAANIPCIVVSSTDHSWNEVYVDNQWLTVDVTANEASAGQNAYLLTSRCPKLDRAPAGTLFAKELLVPGSTK